MAGSRGGQFGKAMLIAGLVELVGIVVLLVISLVTQTAPAAWQGALVASSAVLVAGIKAGVD
ncbi:MAG: hypothetical protein ACRDT4_25515, partial [Micromonosporaceae bacterium]